MKHYAAAYAGRKAGEAVAIVRERTEEKLGAGTVWRIILLALAVGSLFLPANFANGMAGYTLPFVVLVALRLSGSIAVRAKYGMPPKFDGVLSNSHGAMLVFGLSFVTGGVKLLFPSAYFLWAVVSAAFAVAAIIMGSRAALVDAVEAETELAYREGLLEVIEAPLGLTKGSLIGALHEENSGLELSSFWNEEKKKAATVQLPTHYREKLVDEAVLEAKFAVLAPEYELKNVEASVGTFELHPVATGTHTQRANLRASGNLTSETFDIDEGDVRRGRADLSDFSLDD